MIMNNKKPTVPKVLMICKGSAKDGLGHITRTLSVALAMQKTFQVYIVVIGDLFVDNLFSGKKVDYSLVSSALEAVELFNKLRPAIVVFDLLDINQDGFVHIANSTMTVSLSPIFNYLDQVDYIYHRTSILGDDWPKGQEKPVTKSGLEYAVINPSCRQITEEYFRQNLLFQELSVAVSMGGIDAANKTLQVLKVIKTVPHKLLIWVILGEGYAHSYQDLLDSMKDSKNEIILVKTNDSLWRILSTCSVAILSGGTTTYEAAYAGLPTINLIEDERHAFLIQELLEKKVSVRAGSNWVEGLIYLPAILGDYFRHRDKLLCMHQNSKALIDGLGAERITQDVLVNYLSKVELSNNLGPKLLGKYI
jgi:spore coat polysaccharide biosynthesis predicted glycosyltransferase SpsG